MRAVTATATTTLTQSHFVNIHDLWFPPKFKSVSFTGRFPRLDLHCCCRRQLQVPKLRNQRSSQWRNVAHHRRSMDEGSVGVSLDDWESNEGEGASDYVSFSSDGEDSDGEILVTSINDVEMPKFKNQFVYAEDALTVTAHRLAMLGKIQKKKHRISYGFVTNLGLITFLTIFLALLDGWAWRLVRLPLDNFLFLSPFIASAVLVAFAGYITVPILKVLNIRQKFKRKWTGWHYTEKGTPTMGGIFFIPIGAAVAKVMSGSSIEVSSMIAVTLAFAAIGLLDDTLTLMKHRNIILSRRTRLVLEVAAGVWFSFWLYTRNISSPYGMKMLVPLPSPFGLINLGKCYILLTTLTFILLAHGQKLINDLDGLAGGTSALAFVGMSVAVLPICSDVSIFGSSMAGACVGFILHNRHKASVHMGNTGSLALAGALAAMASCSGMFFPLVIASGCIVLEAVSMVMQVSYTKMKSIRGGRCVSHVSFHHLLKLYGIREASIVVGAYVVSSLLAVLAGYIGLISA